MPWKKVKTKISLEVEKLSSETYKMPSLFRPTEYLRASTIDEAVSFLGKNGAKIIAGGTDLLVDKPAAAKCLVDISNLPLGYIKQEKDGLRIGALTTIRQLETSPMLKGPYLALAEAARAFGTVAIRNSATVGGNICNALPSADTPPALLALDASVTISGPAGNRSLPLEKFILGVRKTALNRDELLTEIQIPELRPNTGTAFIKFGRTSVDLALVNAAVRVTLGDGEALKEVRIVVGGGVGPTLVRSRKAEAILIGRKKGEISVAVIEKATKEIPEELTPRPTSVRASGPYKKDLSRVLVKRALLVALGRATGE